MLFLLPIPKKLKGKQRERYLKAACKFLKEKKIMHLCDCGCNNEVREYFGRSFYFLDGKSFFLQNFLEILQYVSAKKGYPLIESEIVFISNYPQEVSQYLHKCIKLVKKVSVFTTNPEQFEKLCKETHKTYGMFLECKGKRQKLKRYQTIYVNLEPQPIVESAFFHHVFLLDSFSVYSGGIFDVLFLYPTKDDEFFKQHHIEKNLKFLEYYQKYCCDTPVVPVVCGIKKKKD